MVRFISAKVAATLGAAFSLPADGGRDLVVHTSVISAGLPQSLGLLAPGGHGPRSQLVRRCRRRAVARGSFHFGRLGIRASQVGPLSPARRARRTAGDRLALALDLLRDPAFDVLITGVCRFDELPHVMARLANGSLPALCHPRHLRRRLNPCSA